MESQAPREGECSPLPRLSHDAEAELPVWLGVSWQPKQFLCSNPSVTAKALCVPGRTPGLDPRAGPGWRCDPFLPVAKPIPTSLVLETPALGEQGFHRGAAWCSSQHVPSGWCQVGVLSSHTGRGSPCSHRTFPAYGISGLGFESR